MFNTVAMIGTGLIGGSLAYLIKELRPEIHLTGVDLPEIINGIPDESPFDELFTINRLNSALVDSDLVILTAPNKVNIELLPKVFSIVKKGSIVSDVGSVKKAIVRKAEEIPHQKIFFIGGHPIGGSEGQGFKDAFSNLLKGSKFILCTGSDVPEEKLSDYKSFLESLEINIIEMEPAHHDHLIAYTSHLPQILSSALALNTGSIIDGNLTAGRAYDSMTRLASSPASIWDEIIDLNKENILESLDLFIDLLSEFKSDIEEGSVVDKFLSAAEARAKTLDKN